MCQEVNQETIALVKQLYNFFNNQWLYVSKCYRDKDLEHYYKSTQRKSIKKTIEQSSNEYFKALSQKIS